MSSHGTWKQVKNGPAFLFRCASCHMLKRRDSSGKWRYFSDEKTRANKTHCAMRRKVPQINVLEMTSTGWAYETYTWPPGHGKIERRQEKG